MEMLRNDYGDGASQKRRVIATVPSWFNEEVFTVIEYFDTDYATFAQCVTKAGVVNLPLASIIVGVR